MIQKDLYTFAATNWESFRATVTELSKDKHNHTALVEDATLMYDFDKICCANFPQNKLPTSADGLDITPDLIRFVEYKSGFKKKITRENFDREKGRCQEADKICEDYWNLFFKNQEKESKELIASIRFKALESYLILEKQFLSQCQNSPNQVSITFTAVIDSDAVDSMIDTLAELSGHQDSASNSVTEVRKALQRLAGLKDPNGHTYCYDSVEVLSVQDYVNRLRQNS